MWSLLRCSWLGPLLTLCGALLFTACPDLGARYAEEELWLLTPSSWEDVEPIFTRRCVTCHGETPAAGATFSLVTYDQAFHWAERVRRRVLISKDMPPGGLQDPVERDTLARWLAQGAPGPRAPLAGVEAGTRAGVMGGEPQGGNIEGGQMGGEAGQGGASPRPLGWSDVVTLFEVYCNTCHADTPTGGAPFPLTTYGAVQPYLERVRVRSIERRDMPPGGIQDPDDLSLLERWLMEGGAE